MTQAARKIVVIGAGIAGLCTAVYARRCGYDVEVLEKHEGAGGLATSWKRDGYTFETCLNWLVGSRPHRTLNAFWREVLDIDALTFVDADEFARIETEHGERLDIFTHVDRLEAELLERAPEDAHAVRRLTAAIRKLGALALPDPSAPWPNRLVTILQAAPCLPLLRELSRVSMHEYGERFTNPLLRQFFCGSDTADLSALALIISLAWMNDRNAGYPIGGSQAVIRGIVAELERLGGRLRLGTAVERILVRDAAATGVRLAGGEVVTGDWVVSAADGHATIYELLGGEYTNAAIDEAYRTRATFPSYLQISFGVARALSTQAGFVTRVLDAPLVVDDQTRLGQVSFRIFHFDPTFAPPGKTAVTCFLPTRNFAYWCDLQRNDAERYQAEKARIAESVMEILERFVPDVRAAIEVVDVSTPATVIRYTGNWKGSMEGWLLTPSTGLRTFPQTLPGLHRFAMVGQWVSPGGGLPSGVMTARAALQAICRQDHVPFGATVLAA